MAPVRRWILNRGKKREGTQGESWVKTLFIDHLPKCDLGALFVIMSLVLGRGMN